ncbi:hypothetical protein A9G16_05740 [Gilliamella apicola]|nr:hypothetical protein A9G16_05740 [Gilliamella apis]
MKWLYSVGIMCKKANFSPIEFIKTTNLSDVSNVLKGTINSFHSKVINKFPFLCYVFLSY